MLIRVKNKPRNPNHPLHGGVLTRRQLIGQGLLAGGATLLTGGFLSLFSNPRAAYAALANDLSPLTNACGISNGAGKIPFICFDLAGGGNIAGSNVLVGKAGGQMDLLGTAGYSKLGIPGDQVPGVVEATRTATSNGDHTDTSLGLAFHSDSAYLRGMMTRMSVATRANVNGVVIPARSENDTSNNPHNPLYGIQKAGADGSILTLAGSQNSVSGGNSMAPLAMINPAFQPTKVDRPSDVAGLVDTGQLVGLLNAEDATAVLESIYRISRERMNTPGVSTGLPINQEAVVKDLVKCGYLKAADVADRFGHTIIDPSKDPLIVGASGIFSQAEFDTGGDSAEFRKTASIMKLVVEGFAGAGCITMGGYDYHNGNRMDGEVRDERAGKCMGAVLEYAARKGVPLMMYVFSDGAISSNGMVDNSVNGRGKGQWTSDNQDTASPFFLVYKPGGRPTIFTGDGGAAAIHQQLGAFAATGDVVRSGTPGANNVNLLVEQVLLNYMALHGQQGQFATAFPNNGLGANIDRLIGLAPIVNNVITNPV
ncbi:MAG: hypothetical protein ABI640_09820 [Gammaproteobacteria bacterium]